jgi:hypothetical protein
MKGKEEKEEIVILDVVSTRAGLAVRKGSAAGLP